MPTQLQSKNRIPYGGLYVVTDPLTKSEVRAGRFDLLVRKLIDARKANGLPIGLDFESEVENWVCAAYPQECVEFNPAIPRVPREIGMGDVVRGTRVMLEHWIAGRPIEERPEAERRAEICSRCRYNVGIRSPCGGICAELREIVNRVIGGKGTSHDSDLGSCSICRCELKSAVWTTLEIQCKGVTEDMKKQFTSVPECWKKCP